MGTSITLNGTAYTIPDAGEGNWGSDVGDYIIASATGLLSKAGGTFTLTAEANFGGAFGLKALSYKSQGTHAGAGILRLANAESIGWRNNANSADIELKVNTSDVLEYGGDAVLTKDGSNDVSGLANIDFSGWLKNTSRTVVDVGDYGLESSGNNIDGTTWAAGLRVNDIGDTNPATLLLHKHSTTYPASILGSRSNSNTSSHTAVAATQVCLELVGTGWTGTHYDKFAAIEIAVDSGTISATSAPGLIVFKTSPDGGTTPARAVRILNDKSLELGGSLITKSGTNDDIVITPDGTGQITLDGLNWPTSDGTAALDKSPVAEAII